MVRCFRFLSLQNVVHAQSMRMLVHGSALHFRGRTRLSLLPHSCTVRVDVRKLSISFRRHAKLLVLLGGANHNGVILLGRSSSYLCFHYFLFYALRWFLLAGPSLVKYVWVTLRDTHKLDRKLLLILGYHPLVSERVIYLLQ